MAVKITLCVLAAFVDLTTEGPKSLHEEKYWIKELQLNEDDRQKMQKIALHILRCLDMEQKEH